MYYLLQLRDSDLYNVKASYLFAAGIPISALLDLAAGTVVDPLLYKGIVF